MSAYRSIKKQLALALLFVLLIGTAGCAANESAAVEEGRLTVFFLEADGDALAAEGMDEPSGDAEEKMMAILTRIVEGPRQSAHKALLPEDVSVADASVSGQTAEIDFTASYLAMSRSQEVLARAGIVRSLVQIPEITYVRFTVEGEAIKDSKGNEVGRMNANTFIENTGKQINTYLHTTIQLCFADAEGKTLKTESRSIYYSSSMPLEWAVVERLIGGPKLKALSATVPPTTQIVSVTSSEGTCYVNVNEGFAADLQGISPEMKIESVVTSLITSCGVNAVQLSINGDTNVSVGEISLEQPFTLESFS